jgi:hypothetical protein
VNPRQLENLARRAAVIVAALHPEFTTLDIAEAISTPDVQRSPEFVARALWDHARETGSAMLTPVVLSSRVNVFGVAA